MRKSTKEIKPSHIVNVDDIETLGEIDAAFALAKQDAGLAITDKEKPWYKRFWGRITKPFKKNK